MFTEIIRNVIILVYFLCFVGCDNKPPYGKVIVGEVLTINKYNDHPAKLKRWHLEVNLKTTNNEVVIAWIPMSLVDKVFVRQKWQAKWGELRHTSDATSVGHSGYSLEYLVEEVNSNNP